jgi:hypothetical protein
MKHVIAILGLMAAMSIHAQTTYTIGASGCSGTYATSASDCTSVPLTLGTTTTTMWMFVDYPPQTAEDFIDGVLGDFEVSNVTIVSTTTLTWVSNGHTFTKTLPTEFTANLNSGSHTGTLDVKLSYSIGATGRYTRGPVPATAGGTVVLE